MGPLAKRAKDLATAIQEHEERVVAEYAKLDQSNAGLRARAKELEEALKGSEGKIEELRQRIRFLEAKLEESRKAIPVVTEQLLREQREPKPMGAGKSSAAILAMAVAAAAPRVK